MKTIKHLLFFLASIFLCTNTYSNITYTLVIHGGAGNISKESLSAEDIKNYENKFSHTLNIGEEMLKNGASALDVAVEVVKILEDSPLFNAGKGSVFNIDGENELDASIMCGKDRNAGAVAGVRIIKNPIEAAYNVMKESPHVMLIGDGAEQFSKEKGLEIVSPSYFFDQRRYDQYRNFIDNRDKGYNNQNNKDFKTGTVGAVVLDSKGNLAAATSTGGMLAKKYGRVGDSPIIGAGTYADNNIGAVSGTGHGEFFIRNVIAYDILAKVKYLNTPIEKAAKELIHDRLGKDEINGGIIAVDKDGNIAMVFNTTAMFRGFVNHKGEKETGIFVD